MIAPDQSWALLAVLITAAAFGLWAEGTAWGRRLSGAVMTMLATFALANLGVIPVGAPVYDAVWSYLVPLAIPLLLLRANLPRLLRDGGRVLIAYGFGALATALGTLLAFALVDLGEEGWKLAAVFAATYIGGSMNFVSAAQAVDLRSGDLLTAAVAADSLVALIYFGVLFALPSIGFVRRQFPGVAAAHPAPATDAAARPVALAAQPRLAFALALSACICAVGFGIGALLGVENLSILVITAITVVLATLAPERMERLAGAEDVGVVLMQVFFAAIGATAHVATVLRVGPDLFVFAGIILLVHLVLVLVAGRSAKIPLPEVLVASNANVGGPTTAAAMATACRWPRLVVPAIVCGTFGYATATFLGFALGTLLQ